MHAIIRPFFLGDALKCLPKSRVNSWDPKKNWKKSSTGDEILSVSYLIWIRLFMSILLLHTL